MRIQLLLFILILYPQSRIKAQTSHYVSTNMLSFMNIHHSYIPIEYNRALNDRFRLNTSLGFILNSDFWRGNSGKPDSIKTIGKHNAKGLRFSIEPQFFFKSTHFSHSEDNETGPYIGLDFNAIRYKYISERAIASTSYQTQRYNVDSKSVGVNLLFGNSFVTTERMIMSGSFGFGVKYLNVKNDLDVPVSSLYYLNRFGEAIEIEEDGNYRRFTVVLNMKIGFRLW